MKRKWLLFWWSITDARRFRVQYDAGKRISKLMTRSRAESYATIFGGRVLVDYGDILVP